MGAFKVLIMYSIRTFICLLFTKIINLIRVVREYKTIANTYKINSMNMSTYIILFYYVDSYSNVNYIMHIQALIVLVLI